MVDPSCCKTGEPELTSHLTGLAGHALAGMTSHPLAGMICHRPDGHAHASLTGKQPTNLSCHALAGLTGLQPADLSCHALAGLTGQSPTAQTCANPDINNSSLKLSASRKVINIS